MMTDEQLFKRSPIAPDTVLSREKAEVVTQCDGCPNPILLGETLYRRVTPHRVYCSSCGDSGKPYGLESV